MAILSALPFYSRRQQRLPRRWREMDSNLRFPVREVVISAFPKWNGSSITEFLVLIDTRDPTDRFGQDEARTLQPRQRVAAVVKRPQRVAVGRRDDDKSDLETMMPKVGPRSYRQILVTA